MINGIRKKIFNNQLYANILIKFMKIIYYMMDFLLKYPTQAHPQLHPESRSFYSFFQVLNKVWMQIWEYLPLYPLVHFKINRDRVKINNESALRAKIDKIIEQKINAQSSETEQTKILAKFNSISKHVE